MKRSVQLAPIADLSPFLGGGEIVAFDVGPDAQVYAAIALEPLDYRFKNADGSSFAKATPAKPQTYRVLAFYEGELTLDLVITGERFNIHHVQPSPTGSSSSLAPGRTTMGGRAATPTGTAGCTPLRGTCSASSSSATGFNRSRRRLRG